MNATVGFGFHERNLYINHAASSCADVLIIGGGITGAAIALDAAARGLSVVLTEKSDFAGGTSSRSTRLVHGGLRYLKQFEFRQVKRTAAERIVLNRLAPHLIRPRRILIPVVKPVPAQARFLRTGLRIYDFLAKAKGDTRHITLSSTECYAREPLLGNTPLAAGYTFTEYSTDDARLVVEILKKAAQLGAACMNYVEVNGFIKHKGTISGVTCIDRLNHTQHSFSAHCVVNASGPWADRLRMLAGVDDKKLLCLSKGVHIVLKKSRLPIKQALYSFAPDGRMIFVIPSGEYVYAGTTDTPFSGNPEEAVVARTESDYLLNALNWLFTGINLAHEDVVSCWAGIRPLIAASGRTTTELSREEKMELAPNGLITMAGGKLTSCRLMAKSVADLLAKRSGRKVSCTTGNIPLSGGDFDFEANEAALVQWNDHKYDQVKQTGITVANFSRLCYRYGTHVDIITEYAFDFYNTPDTRLHCWLLAEIRYGVDYEMVCTLSDFFIRRTSMVHFEPERLETAIPVCAAYLAARPGLTTEPQSALIARFEHELAAMRLNPDC